MEQNQQSKKVSGFAALQDMMADSYSIYWNGSHKSYFGFRFGKLCFSDSPNSEDWRRSHQQVNDLIESNEWVRIK